MLKLSFVSNVSNATVTYDADLTYFSYNVKNNEMLTFTATVPTLSATLKLVTTDAHLEAIKRGDELKVQNADGTGIELVLRAVEVSQIPRKGETEIACSGPFIEKTNEVWGTLLIPAGTLSSTKTQYGLSVLKPLQDSNNAEMFVNVDKKSDLLLGISWSYPEPRNLAVMPFVGGGRSAGPASVGEGIAMFKDRKPGETYTPDEYESEMSAPVYAVDAEDIIEYAISAAQPPVTHLRTSALGALGPTPQIPPVQVLKRSGTPGSEDIHDNVRAYYVQGKSLCALWVAQEDTSGNLVSQTLYWSDGISQTWLGGTKKRIVGIFEGAYIEEVGRHFQVIDRETGATLFDDKCSEGTAWDLQTRELPGTTFFFDKTSNTGEPTDSQIFMSPSLGYVGGHEWCYALVRQGGDIYAYTTGQLQSTPLEGKQVVFGGAARLHNLPGDMLSAIYIWIDYTPGVSTSARFYFWGFHISAQLPYAAIQLQSGGYIDYTPGEVIDSFTLLDFVDFDTAGIVTQAAMVFAVTRSGVTKCTVYRVESGNYIATTWLADKVYFVQDQMTASLTLSDIPAIMTRADDWELHENALSGSATLQSGSISEWAKSTISFFSLFRGAFIVQNYVGDAVWEVYMQMSPVPFISRQRGALLQSTQIANGETNTFDLDFKIGAVQQVGQFDAEKGRIRLKIAGFSKNYFVMHGWHEFGSADIEHLNTMAVGAYVRIRLDPSNPADTIVGKVVSWSTSYDGIVKAELVAIIVS